MIQPSANTANQAVKAGLQETQQVIGQAQKQLSSAGSQAGAAGSQAQQQLNRAAKLASCVAAAGTDISKAQACQSEYAK